MVLWHLNATFTFVFLNRFVILHMCREMKVNVVHFLSLFMFVCGAVCFVFCFISHLCNSNGYYRRNIWNKKL